MKIVEYNLMFLIGLLCLATSMGFCIGRITNIAIAQTAIQPFVYTSTAEQIPVIEIFGIENNKLIANVRGKVRVFFDGNILPIDSDGKISTDASPLFTNFIPVYVPEGMRFFASIKGKIYYPVNKSAGQQIVPKNRIYFKTKEDAESAGYKSN